MPSLLTKLTLTLLFTAVLVFGYFVWSAVSETTVNVTIVTNPDLERGLVGHWTFDGPDFDTSLAAPVRDRSGQGNHGTLPSGSSGFPVVEATTTSESIDATSHTVSLPASIVSGELLLVHFTSRQVTTITWPNGWRVLHDTASSFHQTSIGFRFADGTEGSSITLTTSEVASSVHVSERISGVDTATNPEVAINKGNNTSPNSPSVTPSWGADDTLWLSAIGLTEEQTIDGTPTNYSNLVSMTGTDVGPTGDRQVAGRTQRALNTTSEDPGAYTLSGLSVWIAATVAVKPESQDSNASGTPGRLGQALEFDGVGDFVDIGTGPGSVQTVAFWMKTSSTTQDTIGAL